MRSRTAKRWSKAICGVACAALSLSVNTLEAATTRGAELPPDALALPADIDTLPALVRELEKAQARLADDASAREAAYRMGYLYHANGYARKATALYRWLLASTTSAEESARLNYLLADANMEKGGLEETIAFLEKSIASDDAYPLAYVRLGEAWFKSNDMEKADDCFRKALALDDALAPARLGLARVLTQKGREDEAIPVLESILESDKSNYNAKALLSRILTRRGETERADAISRSITHSSNPPVDDAWLKPVRDAIYDPQRLDFVFLDYFMVDDLSGAEPYLERMEAVDPANPRAYLYRGLMEMKRDDLDAAAKSLLKGIELNGEPGAFYPPLIQALKQAKRFEDAERLARRGLAESNDDPKIAIELAQLLFDRHEIAKSMDLLEKAIARNPYDVETRLLYARAAMWSEHPEKAGPSFDMILQLAPSDPDKLVRAGLIEMESKRFAAALPFFKQAFAVSPSHPEAGDLLADAYCELGRAAGSGGEPAEALDCFRKALEVRPEHRDSLTGEVQALLDLKRFGEAEAPLASLLRIVGETPKLLMLYGDALRENGKNELAEAQWRKAMSVIGRDERYAGLRRQLRQRLDW